MTEKMRLGSRTVTERDSGVRVLQRRGLSRGGLVLQYEGWTLSFPLFTCPH